MRRLARFLLPGAGWAASALAAGVSAHDVGLVVPGADVPVASVVIAETAACTARDGWTTSAALFSSGPAHAPVQQAIGGMAAAGTSASTRPGTAWLDRRDPQRPHLVPVSEDDLLDLMDEQFDAELREADSEVRDPWERFNRRMHRFNDVVDRRFLRPVALGYDAVTPTPIKAGVSRFFGNLGVPVTAVNQLLQGRPRQAGRSLGRFAINTTVGLAGVMDPATRLGVPGRDEEDFGQTLAVWGWRDSRYLVLPLLGPRTLRDAVGVIGDRPLSPIGQVNDRAAAYGLQALQVIDGRRRLLPLDQARQEAYDEYLMVRDAWAQRRAYQISRDSTE